MITLDRATHTYSNNLPSVTTILKSAGLIETDFYTEEGRERGSAVHLACEYFDQGDLDESSIDPQIVGYVEAYKAWKSELGITEFAMIEVPMTDKREMYCGTPDRIRKGPNQLWDIKTGAHMDWHSLQSAAYLNMLENPFSYNRFALYLQNNGKFTVREFPKTEYMADLAIFQSCLSIFYWKESH